MTVASWENSEVLPLGSVAVALIAWPVGTTVGKLAVNVALPLESVVTVVVPSRVWPWP